MEDGSFDLSDPHSIVIGSQLVAAMGARVGDSHAHLLRHGPGGEARAARGHFHRPWHLRNRLL